MKINKIHLITFSPTRTSLRVGQAIAQGWGGDDVVVHDLTLDAEPETVIQLGDAAVVTMPVYGGHLPHLAVGCLMEFKGEGIPVAGVVVYGNRAYEKTLEELSFLLAKIGFKVIAGGTFIGEHSYSTADCPIAAGRPDEDDIEFARLFGMKIKTKVEAATDLEHLYEVDVRRIQRPRQSIWSLLRFVYQVQKMRKGVVPVPRTPETWADRCKHCGRCVDVCPAGAIVRGDECSTDKDKCIKCCACVKVCKQKARYYDTPFAPLLYKCFKRPKQDRIIL